MLFLLEDKRAGDSASASPDLSAQNILSVIVEASQKHRDLTLPQLASLLNIKVFILPNNYVNLKKCMIYQCFYGILH